MESKKRDEGSREKKTREESEKAVKLIIILCITIV